MNEIKCSNKEECYIKITDILVNTFNDLLKTKDNIVFGIPGGRNVSMIFQELRKKNIDWSKIHIFMVDERRVPIDSDESNYKLAYDNFISSLISEAKINKANLHPFKVEEGIESYRNELDLLGGKYDIILLSAGEDGHIAGLFPNHHSIKDESTGFLSFDDSPKMPPERMTLSKNMVINSSLSILMFIGEGKREALAKFNDNCLSFEDVPAKLVNEIENSYVFTDLN